MKADTLQKPVKNAGVSPGGLNPPLRRPKGRGWGPFFSRVGWGVASVALFTGIWEAMWAFGGLNPLLLPPPHIFLANFARQAQYFIPTDVIGQITDDTALLSLGKTILATVGRVMAGLALGFILSLSCGLAICYFRLFGKLVLPTITLLAPISPIAWLPVAIFIFGIGNPPAIFMVFISLFFVMTVSTISQIEGVGKTHLNVAAVMGATRAQTFRYVIIPAILPSLFFVLRMNLFGAWMIVLVAEATGVGSGLGQIVMQARNTFNSSLSFFTMTIIGITGFVFDLLLRNVQKKLLYWVPENHAGGSK
ncbi:ABC transporter permease [Acerihabitans arboris]|uniref:ABC transporter permease subunit n=1 Tax=Acerihabitans arboris TaxID=2691583 RepID=A0A845SQG0_9GAMM|nr:ABC transporter permease [Acerihabitans arboris]NDL65146.1 ABC transporter permease subunit [Acerihabitans arboris]